MLSHVSKHWSMAVLTLGLGIMVGARIGEAALWYGLAILVLGAVLAVVGDRRSTPTGAEDGVPPLSGVGNRIADILRLAETRADEHVAEARRESEAIMSAARLEASEIVAKARVDTEGNS